MQALELRAEATGKMPARSSNFQSELATLRLCWQQWTRVVERYAFANRSRRPVDHAEYIRLHTRLLQSCRSLIEVSEDGQASFYESLVELAKPWMSSRILARTECLFLADLSVLCHRAEKQLTGRVRWPKLRLRFLVRFLCAIGAMGIGLFALSQSSDGMLKLSSVRSYSMTLYRTALANMHGQSLALVGIVVVIASIFFVMRVRRS
jgi:hypothetical protein